MRLCGPCFRARLVLDAGHHRLRHLRSPRAGGLDVVLPAPRPQQRGSHASAGERLSSLIFTKLYLRDTSEKTPPVTLLPQANTETEKGVQDG